MSRPIRARSLALLALIAPVALQAAPKGIHAKDPHDGGFAFPSEQRGISRYFCGDAPVKRYLLENGQLLWSIHCSVPEKPVELLWVVEGREGDLHIAPTAVSDKADAIGKESRFDPKTGVITVYLPYGDGTGCMKEEQWLWDGTDFRIDRLDVTSCQPFHISPPTPQAHEAAPSPTGMARDRGGEVRRFR